MDNMAGSLDATDSKVENNEGLFAKFRDEMFIFRNEIFSTVRKQGEDLQEQITDNEKYSQEMTQQLTNDVTRVNDLATKVVDNQKKEMYDKFSGQFQEVSDFVNKSVADLKAINLNTNDKLLNSIKHIKEVCSKYFEKYEGDLDEQRIKVDTI